MGTLAPAAAVLWHQIEMRGRIHMGVHALGVELGGLTAREATRALQARASELTTRPVIVSAGDLEWSSDWQRLGLTVSAQPIAERAMSIGREGDPLTRLSDQWHALTVGAGIGVTERLDVSTLEAFVEQAVSAVRRPMRNARLDMTEDFTFVLTPAQVGRELDFDDARSMMLTAAEAGATAVELPVRLIPPLTTDEMRLPAKLRAEQFLTAPLTLVHRERSWALDRAELARLLTFSGSVGTSMDVQLDAAGLVPRLTQIAAELRQEPKDATLTWDRTAGAVKSVEPSQEGRDLDVMAAAQLIALQADRADRQLALPVKVTRPTIDSDDLGRLGIRELVDKASTSFAGALAQKEHNVRLAASRLNGHVVLPGATFSFNRALGPTTIANGYKVAFGITSDGDAAPKTVPSVAGGICQVATTLFQPVFWSGYQLDERHWHLYWIPSYSSRGVVGLDATVDEDIGLDFRFTNTTATALLIQTSTDATTVTFELYGTRPDWSVAVDGPRVTDRKPPDTTPVVEPEPMLADGQHYQVETAREGFTASFVRTVTENGAPRTLKLESRYAPSRNVTLIGTGGKPTTPRGSPAELNRASDAPMGRT
ncbi:MAG: VanW family protein [Chloroflexota bacterium]